MATKTITVTTNEENDETLEIVATSIISISDSFEKIKKSRLTERAILLLIHDNCSTVGGRFDRKKPTIKQIKEVLDSISSLKKSFIKAPIKK